MKVFGRETVTRYQVTVFYIQLFATKVISFEKIGTKSVSVAVSEDGRNNKLFEDILNWEGIEFHESGCGGRLVPFEEVLSKVSIARTTTMNNL